MLLKDREETGTDWKQHMNFFGKYLFFMCLHGKAGAIIENIYHGISPCNDNSGRDT